MALHPVGQYFIGFDLGRDRDHSAIAVMALCREDVGLLDHARRIQPANLVLQLGALLRVPLGTEYLTVIGRLRRLIRRLQIVPPGGAPVRVFLVIDSAGPGQIALELLRSEKLGIDLVSTLLTSGRRVGRSPSGNVTIPRRELIANLRYLLEARVIRVQSALRHLLALENEVAAVRPRGGQYEHDDLVIAAGLAAWQAARVHPRLLTGQRAA